MPTKFSQFNNGGAIVSGDLLAGLRNGQDFLFDAASIPTNPWVTITANTTLAANTNYFVFNTAPIILTLPAIFPKGQSIILKNVGTSTFTVAQNVGQQIIFGNQLSTVGIGGSIESNNTGDALTLDCYVANLSIVVDGPVGIWTVT